MMSRLIGVVLLGLNFVLLSAAPPQVTIGLNFTASTFGDDSSALPSDTTGAVGPSHFVEFINGQFAVFDKADGKKVLTLEDSAFWSRAGVTIGFATEVTDPRILFDTDSGRWFASMIDVSARQTHANHFLLAVSETADPAGAWHGLSFVGTPGHNYFSDFPTLGINHEGVYLSGDVFDEFENPIGPVIIAFPKEGLLQILLSTNGMTISDVLDYTRRGEILQPAVTDSSSNSAECILAVADIGVDFQTHSNLVLTVINRSGDGFSLAESVMIPVPEYEIPINPIQPDGVDTLDNGDARISASVRRVGNVLYATHSVEVNDRSAVRWYRIDAERQTLIEAGTIQDPDLDLFYPSIAANSGGTVVIGCNGTSSNSFLSSYAFVGQAGPAGLQFGPRQLLKSGLSAYDTHDSSGISRWGDYSATTADPANEDHFWTIQSYPVDLTTWATQVTELIVAGASLPPLAIKRSGGNVVLEWPNSAGAQLQFTPGLFPAQWSTSQVSTETTNNLAFQTIAATNSTGFFRLVRP